MWASVRNEFKSETVKPVMSTLRSIHRQESHPPTAAVMKKAWGYELLFSLVDFLSVDSLLSI